jgi:hypothetical protein
MIDVMLYPVVLGEFTVEINGRLTTRFARVLKNKRRGGFQNCIQNAHWFLFGSVGMSRRSLNNPRELGTFRPMNLII